MTAFAKAVADTLGGSVTHDQVAVTVGFARLRERARRLASLAVSYYVTGLTKDQATSAASTVGSLSPAAFLSTLSFRMNVESANIPSGMFVESITANPLAADAPTDVPTSAAEVDGEGSAASVTGPSGRVVAAAVAAAAVACFAMAR
jgi:hypothetical protein